MGKDGILGDQNHALVMIRIVVIFSKGIIASNAMIIIFQQVQELGESQCDEPEKPGKGGEQISNICLLE